MEVVWLGEPGATDPAAVGGKTANLSRFAATHRVPAGFCVTTGAAGLAPAERAARVAHAYRTLASRTGEPEPGVAVRSSAVDEDGALSSFAGLHETYLNLRGADAVARAVERCRASATSERARAYRRERGLAVNAGIAVLVQHLVPADVSAVVFTADPATGARDVVVDASWGLGESVVGGTVTPDHYVVRREPLAVVRRTAGAKERMTVLAPEGTREVAVPSVMRGRLVLDDDAVLAAARLALTLEGVLGVPVDVECAFRDGLVYLLQCRPITRLGAPEGV